jgi:hypothetical protein
MSDPNMQEFRDRVRRLERDHARGQGFKAEGTLTRADFRRRPVEKRPVFRTVLFTLAFLFGIKGALHQHLGPDGYAERIRELSAAGGVDAMQAAFMQADPVTLMVSRAIGSVIAKVG